VRSPRRPLIAPRTGAAPALAVALVLLGGAPGAATATFAADPTPIGASPAATAAPEGGDARSPGEGAGLAGAPLVAIGAVAAIGAASAIATLAYVRLTGGSGEGSR
jgi:hypothetical protein